MLNSSLIPVRHQNRTVNPRNHRKLCYQNWHRRIFSGTIPPDQRLIGIANFERILAVLWVHHHQLYSFARTFDRTYHIHDVSCRRWALRTLRTLLGIFCWHLDPLYSCPDDIFWPIRSKISWFPWRNCSSTLLVFDSSPFGRVYSTNEWICGWYEALKWKFIDILGCFSFFDL